jgi:hypothetical protein
LITSGVRVFSKGFLVEFCSPAAVAKLNKSIARDVGAICSQEGHYTIIEYLRRYLVVPLCCVLIKLWKLKPTEVSAILPTNSWGVG